MHYDYRDDTSTTLNAWFFYFVDDPMADLMRGIEQEIARARSIQLLREKLKNRPTDKKAKSQIITKTIFVTTRNRLSPRSGHIPWRMRKKL